MRHNGDDWALRAACREPGVDPNWFFAAVDNDQHETRRMSRATMAAVRAAKAVCWGACPVRVECLEEALARNERFGIWGGETERARRRIRFERRMVA